MSNCGRPRSFVRSTGHYLRGWGSMAQSVSNGGGLLTRWARFASKHPKRVIAGWVVVLIVAVTLATTVGGSFANSFKIPGAESQKAIDLLQARFPSAAGDS